MPSAGRLSAGCRCGLVEVVHNLDGRTRRTERPAGERGRASDTTENPDEMFSEVPRFGHWAGFVLTDPGVDLVAADPDAAERTTPAGSQVPRRRADQLLPSVFCSGLAFGVP